MQIHDNLDKYSNTDFGYAFATYNKILGVRKDPSKVLSKRAVAEAAWTYLTVNLLQRIALPACHANADLN